MNKMYLTMLLAAAAYLAPTVCSAAEYELPQLPDGVLPNTEVLKSSLSKFSNSILAR